MANQYTQKVKEAFDRAKIKGIQFPKHYELPYTVESFSTIGKNPLNFSWELGENPFDSNNQSDWQSRMGLARQPAWAVFCQGERFSSFFLNKNKAQEMRDGLNIRHFNVAALSENPLFPVLI